MQICTWLLLPLPLAAQPLVAPSRPPRDSAGKSSPESKEAAKKEDEELKRAEALLARGDAGAAQKLLEAYLQKQPRSTRALLDLGLAFELQEQNKEAEASYRKALSVDPRFAEAYNNLGYLYRNQKRLDEALSAFRKAVQLRPNFAEAQENLALCLEDKGDLKGATKAYRDAIRLVPKEPLLRANLGLVWLKLGERNKALEALRSALPLAKNNVAALQALGNGLRRAGAFEEALRAMKAAVALQGSKASPALLTELALAYRAAGDRTQAEKTLRRVLALQANDPVAHYVLGNLLAARGALAEAKEHFQRVIKLEGKSALARSASEAMARLNTTPKR